MKRLGLLLFTVFVPAWALAEQTNVPIPGEGWQISFESPLLSQKEEATREDGGYAFRANSDRFNISIFVEPPAGPGTTHDDPYEFYWPQASRNPSIAKKSVKTARTAAYVRVQYNLVGKFAGKPFKQTNVNYYSAFRGKWIDVHISIIEPTRKDELVFAAFDESLRYEEGRPGGGAEAGSTPTPGKPDREVQGYLRDGSVSYLRGDYQHAVVAYSKALEIEKEQSTLDNVYFRVLIDNLGMAYALTGDLARAEETFRYGLTRDGEYPLFYYNLACTYAEMNDMEGALAQLRSAFKYKDNQNPGERMPDPWGDDSFQRFMEDERFLAALREITNAAR